MKNHLPNDFNYTEGLVNLFTFIVVIVAITSIVSYINKGYDFNKITNEIEISSEILSIEEKNIKTRIINNSSLNIKDISADCDFISQSGTLLHSNSITLYSYIPSNDYKNIKTKVEDLHQQTEKISCTITDFIVKPN